MQESVFFTQTLLPLNLTFRMKTLQHCSQAVHRLTPRGSVAAIVVYLYKACWKRTFDFPLGFKSLNLGWEKILGLVTGCSANASLFRWWKALLNGSKSYRIAIPVLAATIYTAKQPKKIEDGLEESEKKHNCVCIGKGLQTLHNEHVKLPI